MEGVESQAMNFFVPGLTEHKENWPLIAFSELVILLEYLRHVYDYSNGCNGCSFGRDETGTALEANAT